MQLWFLHSQRENDVNAVSHRCCGSHGGNNGTVLHFLDRLAYASISGPKVERSPIGKAVGLIHDDQPGIMIRNQHGLEPVALKLFRGREQERDLPATYLS